MPYLAHFSLPVTPHLREMWCIPPKQNAEFVAKMEDVLAVYAREYDAAYPVVCMDEKPFQLLDERYKAIPMGKNNHKKKYDCEYERKGSCSIFMFTEPLAGWRYTTALPQRKSVDWALQIKWLLDEQYQAASKVVLVQDNLNTHNKPHSRSGTNRHENVASGVPGRYGFACEVAATAARRA